MQRLEHDGLEVLALRSLLVVHQRAAIADEDITALRQIVAEIPHRRSTNLAALFVLNEGALISVDQRVRTAYAEVSSELSPFLRETAYVVHGQDLASTGARMVISTMDLLTGGRAPNGIFTSVPSALGWLALTTSSLDQRDIATVRTLLCPKHRTMSSKSVDSLLPGAHAFDRLLELLQEAAHAHARGLGSKALETSLMCLPLRVLGELIALAECGRGTVAASRAEVTRLAASYSGKNDLTALVRILLDPPMIDLIASGLERLVNATSAAPDGHRRRITRVIDTSEPPT